MVSLIVGDRVGRHEEAGEHAKEGGGRRESHRAHDGLEVYVEPEAGEEGCRIRARDEVVTVVAVSELVCYPSAPTHGIDLILPLY